MELYLGDCLEEMKKIPDGSVDLVLTDPPYELGFMGKSWDSTGIANNVDVWKECLRVLKPGGYLLSFGGTRTYHRMASAIEDAGFEVRDMIEWVYGSGFPKSLNIGKAINKIDGVEFDEIPASGVGFMNAEGEGGYNVTKNQLIQKGESSERAKQWEGWGTALKPAHEPICMARKPLSEKTVAENVLKYGTGGINIDESRVAANWKEERPESWFNSGKSKSGNPTYDGNLKSLTESTVGERLNDGGRFPANLIHDNSEEVRECFPETNPSKKAARGGTNPNPMDWGNGRTDGGIEKGHDDNGGNASRFFKAIMTDSLCTLCCLPFDIKHEWKSLLYQAKASKRDRGEGNNHPTVKPVALMEYLVTMTSRDGAVILDPFMGSGTTGVACKRLNRNFIGIEMDETYFNIAKGRIDNA
jgi:DNA modification methylase